MSVLGSEENLDDGFNMVFMIWYRYASIKAIETKSRADDQQWLTYWVIYSLITLFELTFTKLLEWFVFLYFLYYYLINKL